VPIGVSRVKIVRVLKVSCIRGYICIGIAVLCLSTLSILTIIYGYGGSISTDPLDPRVVEGSLRYMEKSAFTRYNLLTRILLGIAFVNGLVGVILYQLWESKQ